MLGRRIASLGAALTALTMLASASSYAAPPSTVGAPGVGDPYFPAAGNGGYDVAHYDLVLSWDPASGRLDGVATITSTALQDLTSFNLDFRTLEISKLSVNGSTAAYKRKGQELTVTPARKLKAGKQYTVSVTYFGVPKYVVDPDGSPDGWIPTEDGVFVANEPQGTPSWFPVNDHPTDKATYTISMTVPNGLTAVGNGSLVSQQTSSNTGLTTFVWSEKYPMASYLATITIGEFQVTQSVTGSGLPIYLAVDPAEAADSAEPLALLPDIIDFEESIFGPYPFETAGAIVDNAPDVGYALETQTKPVYDRAPDVSTVVHEMAHQWFGDSVSLSSWKDIWLNEGFAGYAEWLWSEHAGGPTAKQIFDQDYAVPASNTRFWNPPPGNPGSGETIFDGTVYERGAMTLQALRTKIGDKAFFWVLKSWARIHKYKNATTADFVALAEHVSRQNLNQFFKTWLYTPGKPTTW